MSAYISAEIYAWSTNAITRICVDSFAQFGLCSCVYYGVQSINPAINSEAQLVQW